MNKLSREERSALFKDYDTMLPQGARSRYKKAVEAIDAADDLLPKDALDGQASDLRQAVKHLYTAAENITELLAYRKMYGVD